MLLICCLLCFDFIFSVRFIEENITKMLETKIISNSEVLYVGGDNGDTSPGTRVLQDFQINEGGGGLIRSWVDSMRACSPTRHKSFNSQSCWIVMSSCFLCFLFCFISSFLYTYILKERITNLQKEHPSALNMFEHILHESEGKQIVMFLDYDGTLSPIVDDPDRAFMSKKVVFQTFSYKHIY